jgi:hypothetical protein
MPSTPLTPTDPLNGAVYWLLVTMGVGGLALCVLLPESRELQRLAAAEQAHVRSLNAIRQNLEREERLLEALQGDPAVLARLARRELNYRSPYDRFVTLAAEESAPLVVPEDEPGVSSPQTADPLRAYLPDYDYDGMLHHAETRNAIAFLSIALLATSAGLFWRRPVAHWAG